MGGKKSAAKIFTDKKHCADTGISGVFWFCFLWLLWFVGAEIEYSSYWQSITHNQLLLKLAYPQTAMFRILRKTHQACTHGVIMPLQKCGLLWSITYQQLWEACSGLKPHGSQGILYSLIFDTLSGMRCTFSIIFKLAMGHKGIPCNLTKYWLLKMLFAGPEMADIFFWLFSCVLTYIKITIYVILFYISCVFSICSSVFVSDTQCVVHLQPHSWLFSQWKLHYNLILICYSKRYTILNSLILGES